MTINLRPFLIVLVFLLCACSEPEGLKAAERSNVAELII